jgi:hypothetical protein
VQKEIDAMKNAMKTAILAMFPSLGACDLPPETFGGGTWGAAVEDEGAAQGVAQGESGGQVEAPALEYGELRVAMTSKPTDEVEELWVRFDQVSARHGEEGWVVVSDDEVAINLLKLGGGIEEELALDQVPRGRYGGLSLRIRNAWVVVGGERIALDIPGADRDGLAIPIRFAVPECDTMDVLLHWDVARELTTKPRYSLEPAIRVRSAEFAGTCGAAGGGGTGGTDDGAEETGGELEIQD